VNLDRPWADPQVRSSLPVGLAIENVREHFALAPGEHYRLRRLAGIAGIHSI
jgi:hypothetical protein